MFNFLRFGRQIKSIDSIGKSTNSDYDYDYDVKPILNIEEEKVQARNYWSKIFNKTYMKKKLIQTDIIISTFKKYQTKEENSGNRIESVFEFGCFSGKNLFFLKKEFPSVQAFGIDVNEKAIQLGKKKYSIPIQVSNEEGLKEIPTNRYDFVFTLSVIDHLVEPEMACRELVRIAKKYIVLLEPFVGIEGKLIKKRKHGSQEWEEFLPFAYSWNYSRIFSSFEVKELSNKPCPLGKISAGPHYKLYEFSKIT